MSKRKIVLDADVIIHFSKGEMLSILPKIFPDFDFIILDKVYKEIKYDIKKQLDNQIHYLKNISVHEFAPKGELFKEYSLLIKNYGEGESACMAYCKQHKEVIGSSNINDIIDYCKINEITYLSTLDFLIFAIMKKIITPQKADDFIQDVLVKGSILPNIKIETYKIREGLLEEMQRIETTRA
jgi:predicted nucleic acid-binding protein